MRLKEMKKTNKLNFVNQHIYVGIDVHSKSWVISIVAGELLLGTFTQDPKVSILLNHLKKNYPLGIYHCVYESGFCGFWIHDELNANGIDCIVINAADVPTTHKEKDRKTDKIDSKKLAKSLSLGQLNGIFVHEKQLYEERSIIRLRESLVKEQTRTKNRIKGLMKFFAIEISDEDVKTHWSKNYIIWLRKQETEYTYTKITLNTYLDQLEHLRKLISDITKRIRLLAHTERYQQDVNLLTTIPGISMLSAMILLTELGEIRRFNSLDKLCGYIGLIPSEYSSGEKQTRSHMTKRGKSILKRIIIESSWTAVRKDPALLMCYTTLSKRMKKTRAIITIARKLVSRIMYVLKHKKEYQYLLAS